MTVFLAARSDGLGERLRAMLIAYEIARISGQDFRIHWPLMYKDAHPSHAVRSLEDTFTPEFIAECAVQREFFSGRDVISLTEWDSRPDHYQDQDVVVQVEQVQLAFQAPRFFKKFKDHIDFATAYKSFPFHDDIRLSIDAALEMDFPPGSAGIHLRSGDIIFGEFRFSDRFHEKIVNLPVAEVYVRAMREDNRPVVIFGQDRASIDYLASKHDIIFPETLARPHGFNALQQAIFEITLMSRCSEILAGTSGFAKVASMVGGSRLIDPTGYLDPLQHVNVVEEFLDRDISEVPDLVVAFACRSACLAMQEVVPVRAEAVRLMQAASRLDPENPNYAVLLAIHLFTEGNARQAEQMLFDLIARPGPICPPLRYFLTRRALGGDLVCGATLDRLEEHALAGNPTAALFLAIGSNVQGSKSRAAEFLRIYSSNCRDDWRATCDRVLRVFGLGSSDNSAS